jgi:hypothetical protein
MLLKQQSRQRVPTADGFAFVPLSRTVPPPVTHGIGRVVETGREAARAFT